MNLRDEGGVLTFDILVQPRSSRPRLGPLHGDRLKVAVSAPPVDGEANTAVVELIARTLGVARSAVTVTTGLASRRKTVRVTGASRATLEAAIQ